MFDTDKWQEIFDSLRRHKLRTVLTAFGVFWGIFMLILLLGVGRGLEHGIYSQFGNVAVNCVFIWGGRTTLPYKGLNPGRWVRLTDTDLQAIREEIKEVEHLNAKIGLWSQFAISYGKKSGAFEVEGNLPDLLFIEPKVITRGRFINALDISLKRKTAVIGKNVQEVLFGNEDPIGKYLKIKGVFFRIVGVFAVNLTSSQGMDPTSTIYIPLSTQQQAFNQGSDIHSIGVSARADVPASLIEERIKKLLKARHKVAPADLQGIGSWNMEKEFRNFQGLFNGINIFMWIVGIGTLIAGIVGVSNIMLIIVKERTKEIGIRKALGATPLSIIGMVLQESVFLTALSGYTGLVSGVGIIELIRYLMVQLQIKSDFFRQPEVDINVAVMAVILLVITGALAGLIPARNAAMINPIEALRSE